ncbi:MAG: hypothetical protein ACYTFW_17650 [Planctomycetota bacterium]|jgi:hypothetical protein
MPIVDGQYQAKISTVFASIKQGVEQLKKKIEKSRKVRIGNVPDKLLKELLPLLKDKDVKIILPNGEKPTPELKGICDIAIQKAKIYSDFKGVEANEGSIYFSDVMFCVTWAKDKILQISTMEYDKCVKCMKGTFEMSWRYAQKIK